MLFQPSTKDNYIDSSNPNTNYGTGTALALYNNTGLKDRILLTFDISAFTLPSSAVDTAKMYLYYYASIADIDVVGLKVNVYKLRRNDWHETESTWNVYKSSTNWGTAGAGNTTSDIDTTIASSFNFPAAASWIEIDVKDIVIDAIDNASSIVNLRLNFDVETAGAGASSGAVFYSSEYAVDTTLCPKLEITVPTVTVTLAGETGTWSASGFISYAYISGVIATWIGGIINAFTSPAWTNENKNTTVTFTDLDKNDATMTNSDKHDSTFTNSNKN